VDPNKNCPFKEVKHSGESDKGEEGSLADICIEKHKCK